MLDTIHSSVSTEQADWLTGELLLFGLLGRLLYTLPERDWYRSLVADDVFAELPLPADQPDVAAALQRLQAWRGGLGGQLADDAFAALQADYNRLFVGPGPAEAPLWESVYFNDERMLFQEQTAQVRHWYEAFGLQRTSTAREPEDHLGLELSFLAHLAAQSLQALDEQRPAALDELLSAQRQFLRDHPLRWVPAWHGLVEGQARTDFWRAIAQLTHGALHVVADHLGLERTAEMAA